MAKAIPTKKMPTNAAVIQVGRAFGPGSVGERESAF